MSTRRKQPGGWAKRKYLARGPNGRVLCRRCGQEVAPPRRTFCSDACVHEWRLRTDPAYLRERVLRRDKGVCAICGLNTVALSSALRKLNWRGRQRRCAELGVPIGRIKSLWDADHVVPVVEGGGECTLENMRTLCIPCHKRATADLRQRLKDQQQAEQFAGFAAAATPAAELPN
jgi:5-methylcytosine-specific restriction enzyme A